MRIELRMAWREARPAWKRFAFMVVAIALGVAAVTGIRGFGLSLDRAISRSARELVAGDLAVRFSSAPDGQEQAVLDMLVRQGAVRTQVTETLSMAATGDSAAPLLSTIRAVDPGEYPFYGKVELEPPLPLSSALGDGDAAVSRELLTRTGAALGDRLQIGSVSFRIAAVLVGEPDRIASGFELGPRIMITRRGLERSGLIQFGSRATETFIFRLPRVGLGLEEARAAIASGVSRPTRVTDYRNPSPSLARGLERMTSFLSLIGLLAIVVGGLGVSTTVHAYLRQKLDTIAVLKCLGAGSKRIIRIYLIQGLLLGLSGSLLGVILGYLLQLVFPWVVREALRLPTAFELAPGAALQGLLVGLGTTMLFVLPPLLAIRKVRPARVFLREMPETQLGLIGRLRRDALTFASVVVLLAGLGLQASWLAHSWARGFGFLAGLAGAVSILALGARVLLFLLQRLPRPSSLALRHGLKNLYRPGSQVVSVLVALGIGVAFVVTVYLIQTSLLSQILRSAPSDFPNLFLLGVTGADKDPLWTFLREQPGMEDAADPIPAISARLQLINGRTADELQLEPRNRRFFQIEFILSWSEQVPPDTRIAEGRWWVRPFDAPLISVSRNAARLLGIEVGSTLEFDSSGWAIRGAVANIRESGFTGPGSGNQFIFSPGALDAVPASYVGALRVAPTALPGIQSALFARFPGVTCIDVGQVLLKVQDLIDKVADVIRFVAVFAISAGVVILAASVASTRYQRIREAVILKTLGATRSQVARIQAAEFLIIGLAAGFIGCLVAAAAAAYLLGTLLDTEFEFRWAPLLVAAVATAALAIATGWIASRGVLSHRPLEVLREN